MIVVKRTAYIHGNAYTFHNYFGFTKAQSSRYAGDWISIPYTSPGYSTVSADATFGSFLYYLFPQRNLRLVKSTIAGERVVGIRGVARLQGTTVLETLYAPAQGKRLPLEEKMTSPGHPGNGVTTMTNWGERVEIHAPAHYVPISKVVR